MWCFVNHHCVTYNDDTADIIQNREWKNKHQENEVKKKHTVTTEKGFSLNSRIFASADSCCIACSLVILPVCINMNM